MESTGSARGPGAVKVCRARGLKRQTALHVRVRSNDARPETKERRDPTAYGRGSLRLSVCGRDNFVVKIPNAAGHVEIKTGLDVKVGWETRDARALDA